MIIHIPVTLQISLAPTDLPHALHILPHQLRQLGRQVDEILFIVDLHRSRGKFAEGWEERLPGLRSLIDDCCERFPHARSVDVDYTDTTQSAVSAEFFDGQPVPIKDFRGGPFYAYLFGLHSAQHDHVFHTDSDVFYGGGSTTWVAEAVAILHERTEVLACNPLPGPPTSDGSLRSQDLEPEHMGSVAFRSPALSTRLFLLDRRRLPPLRQDRPPLRRALGARLDGNPPIHVTEMSISRAMARSGLIRIDFLGQAPGMWSLHPPYRSARFYAQLPSIIDAVESGLIPEQQRGHHDVEDCTIDWSDVRPNMRNRVEKHLRLLIDRAR